MTSCCTASAYFDEPFFLRVQPMPCGGLETFARLLWNQSRAAAFTASSVLDRANALREMWLLFGTHTFFNDPSPIPLSTSLREKQARFQKPLIALNLTRRPSGVAIRSYTTCFAGFLSLIVSVFLRVSLCHFSMRERMYSPIASPASAQAWINVAI